MAKRKPSNLLTLSRKPSLKRSPVLVEAERKVKEKKAKERAASKSSAKTGDKPAAKEKAAKKPAPKKAKAKTPPAKKGKKDPMWKNLAAAFKRQGEQP